jgi:hypothetical protein
MYPSADPNANTIFGLILANSSIANPTNRGFIISANVDIKTNIEISIIFFLN